MPYTLKRIRNVTGTTRCVGDGARSSVEMCLATDANAGRANDRVIAIHVLSSRPTLERLRERFR